MKAMRISVLCAVISAATASATVVDFTGVVPFDFGPYLTSSFTDPIDVGLPPQAPPGAISGWEIQEIVFFLSLESDILQIGLDAIGIAGDVDGNGIDGNAAQWLVDNGGVDYLNLFGSESMGIAFDFDGDGTYDIIAGVSGFDDVHKVCEFSGFSELPFLAFGTELPQYDGGHFYNHEAYSPDYELSIIGITDFIDETADEICVDFLAFGGSFEDDGVGEEKVFGNICIQDGTLTNTVVPEQVELTVYPNPFNPTTTMNVTLNEAGPVSLTIYNVSGQPVRTLVNENLSVGEHSFEFNATGLPSGIYIAHMQTTTTSQSTRLMLLK